MKERSILRYDKSASRMKLKKCGLAAYWPPKGRKDQNTWQQTVLPLGNGTIGLSVYGDEPREQITLNCKTLWAGGPSPKRPDYAGGNRVRPDADGKLPRDYYRKIKELFLQGKNKEASDLCAKLVGEEEGYGTYLCWGKLIVDCKGEGKTEGYSRTLDLERAICNVEYRKGGTRYTREYFVSYPHNAAFCRFGAVGDQTLNLRISVQSMQGAHSAVKEDRLTQDGRLDDNDLAYSLALECESDGAIAAEGDSLTIKGARRVELYLALDTDYDDNYPVYRTGETSKELAERVRSRARKARETGYETARRAHIDDYQSLFRRASIDLGGDGGGLTTDRLLRKYGKATCPAAQKRALEELLFDFGRYLTISSSRERDLLPSNLQGIWNCTNTPAWSSDFHMNVNLQMNYWPVYVASLSECAKPLIRYVDALRAPGRVTAEYYTGLRSAAGEQNGFVCHNQNTPFGWTCPGWEFDWGWSPVSAAWIMHNIYECYQYGGDRTVLREQIYPMLKECVAYFDANLTRDPHTGRLVCMPSYSPEHGPRTMGNTYEQTLIWQLYRDCIDAAEALGADLDARRQWESTLNDLRPIEIGASGQIKEWYHEIEIDTIGQKRHRHLSHLLGVYPCALIDRKRTPEAFAAARVSLDRRGDKSTGWAMGQRINAWARLCDGDRAYRLIGMLMTNGIYPNLWDAHPPFQIDGNFGYVSGVCEMLMQSHTDAIALLPALPRAWQNGCVAGLTARGNRRVDLRWLGGALASAQITPAFDGPIAVAPPDGRRYAITDERGIEVRYEQADGVLRFEGIARKTYAVVPKGAEKTHEKEK